jgi:hypothetical protein
LWEGFVSATFPKIRQEAGGNLRKKQGGRLVARVRLWADRRLSSD